MENGTKFPKWAIIWGVGALLGFQAAGIFFGQKAATDTLVAAQAAETKQQTRELVGAIAHVAERDSLRAVELSAKVTRVTNRINEELHQVGRVTGYISRRIDD